jgi:MATE family multidrug resistance protein
MAAMTLAVMLGRDLVPLLFLGAADAAATAGLAATLLMVGASFFIADGVQTVAVGALRGLNDTRVPMVFAGLCFWVIGFAACYVLGFPLGWGAVGIWIGLSFAVIIYALLLVWRFHALSRSGYLPEVARSA